jgi:hypothetical protein
MSLDKIKKRCQKEVRNGKNKEEIIEFLHISGLTITESMKIIKDIYKISLGEAKAMVAGHPIWNNVVDAAKPLQNDLISSIEDNS